MATLNIERRKKKIMEDYIVDAKKVMNIDILKDEYDYIADVAMSSRINGFYEGAEKKSLEIATNLLKSGMTVEFIHENAKLSVEEIKKIKNSFSKEVME